MYETEDCGSIKNALKRFGWKLFHRHGECPYQQTQSFQHFSFTIGVNFGDINLPVWNDDNMRSLIKENNIQPGDMISLYCVAHKNGGRGNRNFGGREFVVLENGWKMIGRIMGP